MKHTQESASWKGFPGSRGPCPRNLGPGLILKSGTGIVDWHWDSDLRDQGFRDSTLGDCSVNKRIPGLGPGD